MNVRALVLTGFGLNCDNETAFALTKAGARVEKIHINAFISNQASLEKFHILTLGGGFSWGDDHGAGVIQALKLKKHLGRALSDFVEDGKLIIGICNGFQTLVNIGLLPGLNIDDKSLSPLNSPPQTKSEKLTSQAAPGNYTARSVALTFNDCGNFRNHWVDLVINSKTPCIFTRGLDRVSYPIRHGEGKFIADPDVLKELLKNQQVVVQYADSKGRPASGKFPENPNGSLLDIAGICDPTGRIFGLMPHPEAYNHITNHPHWTRHNGLKKDSGETLGQTITTGIALFKNGVDYILENFS